VLAAALVASACGGPDDGEDPAARELDRVVVYQLAVRLFGNVRGVNRHDGDLSENGVGKFAHIDGRALAALAELGVTHVWLTGVLQQATHTDHTEHGQPPDDPDVLKGKAGSFYAVRDYFDVCPDYALDPAERMAEFESLVARIHAADMKVVIDLVPNHVARTYHSDVRPDLDFGAGDDTTVFFSPRNNFFYLVDPPGQVLSLPEPSGWTRPPGADGTLETEDNDGTPPGDVPRVTGNNRTSPTLDESDWYETVKLNYGYDFVTGTAAYDPVPDTWLKMDEVIAYWQGKGVDGFRCDFAHWIPVQAWRHLIEAARARDPDAYFFAEAYESSDAPPGFSLPNLVGAGFDAVYDDRTYDVLKRIHCCGAWANDVDAVLPNDLMFSRTLRYGENHDERRLASPLVPGDDPDASGLGSLAASRPFVGTLYLQNSGPLLVYNGQEVGEEAAGAEGFSGDDGRTSIFDYWTMPRFAAWVGEYAYDGSMLGPERRALRAWYVELMDLAARPGFASGGFYSLQSANAARNGYGGGRYLYSFLRYDNVVGTAWLVVANHGPDDATFDLVIPREALEFIGVDPEEGSFVLAGELPDSAPRTVEAESALESGVPLAVGGYDLAVCSIREEP
jgi:glycosidase